MKKFLILLSLSLSWCLPAHAQSTAQQVQPGNLQIINNSVKFVPLSTTNPLPIAVYDAGNNSGYCYTSNGSASPATFQVCGGGGGGVPGGSTNSIQYNAGSSTFGGISIGTSQILIGQNGTFPAAETLSGDGTIASNGALTIGSIGGKAVSLGGSLTTSGAFNSTFTMTGATNVTFPTSGTLSTTTGTVTAVTCATANGVSCTVASQGTTPALTFTLGAITPSSVNGITISNSNTPTWTIGSSSGTPVVTASSPLVITTATGNITCPTCNTSSSNVNSITGDGVVISNSASTGTVTLTQANMAAKTIFGNPTSGSTTPVGTTAPIVSGILTASGFTSTVTTGTAPLIVASTTNVVNLNASTLTGDAVGTSGGTIPLLNGANTWSGTQTFGSTVLSATSPAFAGTVTGNNTIPLSILSQVGTNTVLGNSTSGTANVTALSVGGCSSSSSALIWTTNTGFGCNTAITASTVTTNANLTGPVTSVGNATTVNYIQAAVAVGTTSAATAGTILDLGNSLNASLALLLPSGTTGQRPATGVNGMIRYNSTATPAIEAYVNNVWSSLTSNTGTVTSIATTSPITGGTITTTGTIACATCGVTGSPLSQFASTTSAQLAGVMSDETGTGALVFGTAPTITLANGTGLPISTGVSGLGTGVATFLATPSSANLAAAITDETGTGLAVFGTAPTFTTSITDPVVIGGSAVGSSLELRSTSNTGTTDFTNFTVGTNGGTEAMRIVHSGAIGIGTTVPHTGVILDLGSNSTTANSTILLPSGTTGARPTVGINGMLRYNTTSTPTVEAYVNNAWASLGSGGGSVSITAASSNIVVSPSPITGTGTVDLAAAVSATTSVTSPFFNATTVKTGYEIGGQNGVSFPTDSAVGSSIAIGSSALAQQSALASTAFSNTAIGYQAMSGIDAGTMTTASINNTVIGYKAMSQTGAGSANVFVGSQAGVEWANASNAVGVGAFSLNWDVGHTGNTAVGYKSSFGTNGANITSVGYEAGQGVQGTTTASQSTFIGSLSGNVVTTATNNTFLGYNTGVLITSGGSNTIIGAAVGSTTLNTGTGNILMGVSSAVTTAAANTSNTINIGGTGGSWVLVTGTNTNTTELTTLNGSLTLPTGAIGVGTTLPNTGVSLDLGSNTNSMLLPAGTTGQRPSPATNGMLRYNTTSTAAIEGYVNNSWTQFNSAAAGSSWVLIGTATASNSTSVSFTNIPTGYNQYIVVLNNIVPVTNATSLRCQIGEGATPTYGTTGYVWQEFQFTSAGSGVGGSGSDSSFSFMTGSIINTASLGVSGQINFNAITTSGNSKTFTSSVYYRNTGPADITAMAGGVYNTDTNVFTALQFTFNTGNISSGNFALYGVRNQ